MPAARGGAALVGRKGMPEEPVRLHENWVNREISTSMSKIAPSNKRGTQQAASEGWGKKITSRKKGESKKIKTMWELISVGLHG